MSNFKQRGTQGEQLNLTIEFGSCRRDHESLRKDVNGGFYLHCRIISSVWPINKFLISRSVKNGYRLTNMQDDSFKLGANKREIFNFLK